MSQVETEFRHVPPARVPYDARDGLVLGGAGVAEGLVPPPQALMARKRTQLNPMVVWGLLRELQKRHQDSDRVTERGGRADDPRSRPRYRW